MFGRSLAGVEQAARLEQDQGQLFNGSRGRWEFLWWSGGKMLDSRGDYLRESGDFCPDLSRKCLNFDALGTADGGWARRDDEGVRDMQSRGFEMNQDWATWDLQIQTRTRTGVGEQGLQRRKTVVP